MSSFASLLAQSKAQTQVRNAEVQSTLAQRQERERREQEEREHKYREELARQAKHRQAQLEAEKREAERAKQRKLEQQAKEQERERKKKAEMDKLLGKKRYEEREKESNGAGSRVGGSGSPRKRRSRSNSPVGGGNAPVLTRLERRALKTDPNARPAWAISLVGVRGGRSGSPSTNSKHTSGVRTKKSSQSTGMRNGNGYGEVIKLSRKETGSVADYLEEKRKRELAAGKSKSYLNIGDSSSRAASTGPLPSKSKDNGLKHKSAPSSVAGQKRRRSDEEDEDSMFDSGEDDGDDVPPTKRRAMGGSILARFGLNLNQREYRDYDDDDLSDMEAGYDEVQRENERAYVFFFLLSPPASVLWDTEDIFRPQFARSEA